jgi:hypothetical protein
MSGPVPATAADDLTRVSGPLVIVVAGERP